MHGLSRDVGDRQRGSAGSVQCRHRLLYAAIRGDLKADPVIPMPTHGGHRRYFNYSTGRLTPLDDDRITMLAEAPAVRRVRRGMDLYVAMERLAEVAPAVPL